MKNYCFTVKYNGKNYYGWNVQPNKKTIVSQLTKAFQNFYDKEIKIFGSGRTDRGVHALGQTFNVHLETKIPPQK